MTPRVRFEGAARRSPQRDADCCGSVSSSATRRPWCAAARLLRAPLRWFCRTRLSCSQLQSFAPWASDGALRCRLVVAFARLVDLVGALARPLAAGAGAVPGGAELVGHLGP